MKKNVMMRIASVLLVAVMLTTCVISGTFAKYVTSDSGSDNARVAKWGVVITPNGTAFGTAYKAEDGKISATYAAATDSVNNDGTVDSKNLVAPGTGDTVAAMNVTGKPEVDVNVSFDAQLQLENWVVDGYDYCPIIFTVEGKTYGLNGLGVDLDNGYDNIAILIAGVEKAIEDCSANYEANTNLATAANVPNVSWEWKFYVNDVNDGKDTKLGDAATAATITLTVETTVTQVD